MEPGTKTGVLDPAQLMKMSRRQLDDLFKASPPGPVPDGEAQGTAIIAPGTVFSPKIAEFVRRFAWRGKTFDGKQGMLTSRILFGLNAIANVYVDKSWFDGHDCIVLDYSKTSLIAHWVRDEIRLVAPNFYLGLTYWSKTRLVNFSLRLQLPAGVDASRGLRHTAS